MTPESARRAAGWVGVALVVVGGGLMLLAVLRGHSGSSGSPASTTTQRSGPSTTSASLADFGEVAVRIRPPGGGDGHIWCLLLADTPKQRARGLMEVTDPGLDGHAGMLFRFPEDASGGFWMRNTPLPLSIAYVSSSGELVDRLDMAPCADSPRCPTYPPSGPYRYAVEVPQGHLDSLGLEPGSSTEVLDGACPASG